MTNDSASFIAKVNKHSLRGNIYMHVEFNQLFGKETAENYSINFTLNLMSDTPKKRGKKRSRKPMQREASHFSGICRINLMLK